MKGANGTYIQYDLYSDPQHTMRWGNHRNTDTVAGTGNGQSQELTAYGRVSPQAITGAGQYSTKVVGTIIYLNGTCYKRTQKTYTPKHTRASVKRMKKRQEIEK